jgi:hypothetical protein
VITRIVEGIDGARQARGAVVVIDVMRAFTTAAYAFDAGWLKSTWSRLSRKRSQFQDSGWVRSEGD